MTKKQSHTNYLSFFFLQQISPEDDFSLTNNVAIFMYF